MRQRILIVTTAEGSSAQVQFADGVVVNATASVTMEEAWLKAKTIIMLYQEQQAREELNWNKVL